MKKISSARGRLAPSPTGYLHLGNAWAFMHAWASVRSKNGSLVLRIDDIDPDRARLHFIHAFFDDLQWLGLTWDEGPFFQSSCQTAYRRVIEKLTAAKLTYRCYCTRRELRNMAGAPHADEALSTYSGTCRFLTKRQQYELEQERKRWGVRVYYPNQPIKVSDIFLQRKGALTPETALHLSGCTQEKDRSYSFTPKAGGGDFIISRSDGVVAYALASVVDDMYMGITEVVRGNDIFTATPKQVVLHDLLGNGAGPVYGHVPLLLDAGGERLAKRHNGLQIRELRLKKIHPEAIWGYLAWRANLVPSPRPMTLQEIARLHEGYVPGGAIWLSENIEEELKNI